MPGCRQTSGRPLSTATALCPGIDHGDARLGRAHHGCQHEQRLAEGAGRGAAAVKVAGIIGIHEHIAAGLDFVIDAGRRLQLESAGAAAADNGAFQPLLAQLLDGAPRRIRRRADQAAAFLQAALVLGAAVIGLQAAKDEMARGGDALGQRHRIRPRRHAATARPDIDLHQHRQAHPGLFRGGFGGGDLGGMIGAQGNLGDVRQRRQPRQLGRAHHLVAHQDVGDAAPGQRLGLRHFLHALADRAARDLKLRDHWGFVGLGMGAQPCPGRRQQPHHAIQIMVEGIEIDQQGGGIDLILAHAGLGGRRLQHGKRPFLGESPPCIPLPRAIKRPPALRRVSRAARARRAGWSFRPCSWT